MQVPHDVSSKRSRWPSPSMVVAVAALVLAVCGGAYAAGQINGANIKNNTVGQAKFTPKTRMKLNHNVGAKWGIITRNTIGSAVADLRTGPYGSFGVTGGSAKPPFGIGSLGIQVSDDATTQSPPAEKASYGNEVDFFGQQVANLNQVGFRVFQTGENVAISPSNMPNISLEIDPNVGATNYTTMIWVPDPAPVTNRWSGFINAATTGDWYFTGTAGTITGCNQSSFCSLSAAKAALVANQNGDGPATIDTVAVTKGRDNAWVGAVDGLRINSKTYNFEPYGVEEISTP